MKKLSEHVQSADWKSEKHVPVIECADRVSAGEAFDIKVSLGKEVAHPNTTEHHIRWIKLFFYPDGAKYSYDVGSFEFNAHGEAASGPNEGPVYTNHQVTASLKITTPGVLHAMSYCNIHGLWESSKAVQVA
ncbi:class II SORL domain-containing protein [candidate division KSB1 bacterium]|nr:class II SORL domain-containing protein [candidate division KSB1 bacterium]